MTCPVAGKVSMAAANRGKCFPGSVGLHELLQWPLADGVLLHIGLVSALNVVCLTVVQDMPVLVLSPGDHPSPSRDSCLLLGLLFCESICFCVPKCWSL